MTKTTDLQVKKLESKESKLMARLFGEDNQEYVRVGLKGYSVPINYLKISSDIFNMELKPDDLFVASYQRSGTTWTQELVWLLANDLNYEDAAAIPLVNRYAFVEHSMLFGEREKETMFQLIDDVEKVQKIMNKLTTPATEVLPALPSPRFIKTHLPMSLLPPTLLDSCKVVYVARDPRDVAVSCYHHARLLKLKQFQGTFKDLWNAFVKDLFVLTPIFEHVKEAWSMKDHPNMLFLFYEDLIKDLPAAIRRVAKFLNKELTQQEIDRLCDHLSIENFKKNQSVNYEEMRVLGLLDENETFIRNGKSGSWRDYFDEEMREQADFWITENLRCTDLRFPNMNLKL